MNNSKFIDIYQLPIASNVCNQILREVIKLPLINPVISMAHVTMAPNNVSLWHQHKIMYEIYFIINGEGILYYNNKSLKVQKGAYLILPPNTPHKLKNTGNTDLEHLVFAIPTFNPNDVEILNDCANETMDPEIFKYEKPPMTALDGALIYELTDISTRNKLNIALATGFLPKSRKAIPHYHKISEEIYYICSGIGRIIVGDECFNVTKGSTVYIPTNTIHALENKSDTEELYVLCITSPAYTKEDFLFPTNSKKL